MARAQRAPLDEPSIELTARDLARGPATAPRAVAVLRNEVTLLERLLGATRQGDPMMASLCERQMRALLELSRAVRAQSPEESRQALERAFALSRRLAELNPSGASSERNALAHASLVEELVDLATARPLYMRLVAEHPTGTTPAIVFALFGDETSLRGDPEIAQRFYERAMASAPRETFLHGYCLYRLAWLDARRSRDQESLRRFTEVLSHARNIASMAGATELAAAARRDLVVPYARIGRRDRAEVFFRRFATPEETREMLARLDALVAARRRHRGSR